MASHHSNILATDIKNVSVMYETCNNLTIILHLCSLHNQTNVIHWL